MKRIKFIKYLGLFGLSLLFTPLKAGDDYSYGTSEYPIRAVLREKRIRISELGIFESGKLIHKLPIRTFEMKQGDKLTIILEIVNRGK